MRVADLDFETHRFGPCNLAPKPVCVAVADSSGLSTLVASCEPEFDDVLVYALEADLIVNTKLAFDMAVILQHRPKLADKVWDAYRKNKAVCLIVREKLMVLADSGDLEFMTLPNGAKVKIGFSQLDMERKYLSIDRGEEKDEEDAWRKNYEVLDGRPVSDYPQEARDYPLGDANNGLAIFMAQQEKLKETPFDILATQHLNSRADLALYLSSCWGFPVDVERVEKVYKELSQQYHEYAVKFEDGQMKKLYDNLLQNKILRPSVPTRPHKRQETKAIAALGGVKPLDWEPHVEKLKALGIQFTAAKDSSYNQKNLRAHVELVCKKNQMEPKKTDPSQEHPEGQISLSVDEHLTDLEGLDDTIDEYIERDKIKKLVTTELPGMRGGDRVHPKYDIIKKTARTSSYGNSKKNKENWAYPSKNIQQVDPRVRESFIASKGKALCSVDYNYIELVSIAQKCLDLFGQSVLADKINRGMDPHAYLGASIMAALNSGWSTGDGDGDYEQFIPLKKTDRPTYDHYRNLAKPTGLGYPGGLGAARFIGYAKSQFRVDIVKIAGGHDQAIELAKLLKVRWKQTFPEMDAYFKWIARNCVDTEWSAPDDERYCYISPNGMVRRNCLYTEATNGAALQTPTAEGAKISLWDLAQACYDTRMQSMLLGCHMVAFIHDEVIVELPLDDLMHDRAYEIARIMREGMSQVMTKVRVGAEPACMLRWNKKAEAVFDANNRLKLWTPPSEIKVA